MAHLVLLKVKLDTSKLEMNLENKENGQAEYYFLIKSLSVFVMWLINYF